MSDKDVHQSSLGSPYPAIKVITSFLERWLSSAPQAVPSSALKDQDSAQGAVSKCAETGGREAPETMQVPIVGYF